MTRRRPMAHEDKLQRAVAELLDHLGWLWWHTPNSAIRRGQSHSNVISLGVKRGVPDVLIFERWHDPRLEHTIGFGVAIELKVGKNTTTKEQDQMLAELRRRGWLTAVCRSLDEVIEVCRWVLPLNCRRLPNQEVRRHVRDSTGTR